MNTLRNTLVALAAATLAATALGSTQASAWCGESGYSAYDDSAYDNSYGYDYGSYGGYDHGYGEHRDFDRRGRGDFHGRRDFSRRH